MPIAINGSGTITGISAGGLPDLSITTADLADGAVTTAKVADANITAAKLGGAQSGSAPIYAARAWVNFNGTSTVAIRASGNVSSITDNGTGDYTVNFTTAMADANYCIIALGSRQANTGPWIVTQDGAAPTTSTVRLRNRNGSMTLEDCEGLNVAVFR